MLRDQIVVQAAVVDTEETVVVGEEVSGEDLPEDAVVEVAPLDMFRTPEIGIVISVVI